MSLELYRMNKPKRDKEMNNDLSVAKGVSAHKRGSLALIQDYHPNFYYTYKELSKYYDLTMFGDSYYPVPKDINLVRWETIKLGKVYIGDAQRLRKLLKGYKLAIVKDYQFKSLQAINVCKLENIKYCVMLQTITKPLVLNLFRRFIGKDTPIIFSVDVDIDKAKWFKNVSYIPFSIEVKK